jgi:hypothetical protein
VAALGIAGELPAGDIQNVTAYFENAKVKQFGVAPCT